MAAIIKDEVAIQYSWTGRKQNKRSLEKLEAIKLLVTGKNFFFSIILFTSLQLLLKLKQFYSFKEL